MSGLDIRPVAGALGAEVTGIDLRTVTDVDGLDGLKKALADNLVVFLPDQHLNLDDLERVTDLLGGRDVTPYVPSPRGPALRDPGHQGAGGSAQLRQRLALAISATCPHRRPTPCCTPGTCPTMAATRCGRTSTWLTKPCQKG